MDQATLVAIERAFREHLRHDQGFKTFAKAPTGHEKGHYLAVNWGGTNLTIYLVELSGAGQHRVLKKADKIKLTAAHRTDPRSVFDLIAQSIKALVKNDAKNQYKIGFVYGFPIEQNAINSGLAVRWSKGFKDKKGRPVIGEDIAELLNEALRTVDLPNIQVSALMNDTLNPLLVKAYELYGRGERAVRVVMGSVIGTGTNDAAVFEEPIGIRNLEAGNYNFGSAELLKKIWLEADRKLDAEEKNPPSGKQLLEKMVSGKYLGEIVRRLAGLKKPYSVTGEDLSKIENDKSPKLEQVAAVIGKNSKLSKRKEIKAAARRMVMRSAAIVAAKYAAIIKEIDQEKNGRYMIAIEGSVAEKYPHYLDFVRDTLSSLGINAPGGPSVNVVTTPDAQGVGAAILAASV